MSINNSSSKEELRKRILSKEIFEPMLNKTFNDTDINKNGYIEIFELANFLKSIYKAIGLPSPSDIEIEKELKRLDRNGDNKISKEEFRILVQDLCLYFIDKSF